MLIRQFRWLAATALVSLCGTISAGEESAALHGPSEPSATTPTDTAAAKPEKRVRDAARDVATACRYFRELLGRWPKDWSELKAKADGIDFAAFPAEPMLAPEVDDTERLRFFDGVHWWEKRMTRMSVNFPPEVIKAAQSADFKIRLTGP